MTPAGPRNSDIASARLPFLSLALLETKETVQMGENEYGFDGQFSSSNRKD